MNIQWAARQLKEGKPVRRKSWDAGEFAGNDGSLFYRCAHEETYNSPSVTCHFDPSLKDMLATDWVSVKVLPCHGWVLQDKNYTTCNPYFYWTKKDALAAKKAKTYGKWEIKKVTKNLFSNLPKS